MRYFSDLTREVYETEKECLKAEKEWRAKEEEKARAAEQKMIAEKKKQEERAEAAKKVEAAREAMVAAQKAYSEELTAFCKKFGTYHYSVDSFDRIPHLFDFLL